MVNKCSFNKCKSLYSEKPVKLHRFPLKEKEVLSVWKTFTGKSQKWEPKKSSRLCSKHFKKSDYMIGHKKGILKPKAIPTIEYRQVIPEYKYTMVYPIEYQNIFNLNNTFINAQEMKQHITVQFEFVDVNKNDDISDMMNAIEN